MVGSEQDDKKSLCGTIHVVMGNMVHTESILRFLGLLFQIKPGDAYRSPFVVAASNLKGVAKLSEGRLARAHPSAGAPLRRNV